MIILSIIVFILILALLVLAHEFGHFIMAKRAGMQVEEFGFGFPPRLFGVRKGETLYSVNLIPLGGFVKIVGENNEELDNPRSFVNKGFWPRLATLVAGVVMNFILAWVLISIGLAIGLPTSVAQGDKLPAHAILHEQSITILAVEPNTPAAKVGLQEGDQIVSVDNKVFTSLEGIAAQVKSDQGKNTSLQIKRGNENLNFDVLVRENPPVNEGAVGIEFGSVGLVSFPWYLAPFYGLNATYQATASVVGGFIALFHTSNALSQLGGPVRIAALTNQVTKLGFIYVLQFAALLSINLAILNIIPFPALDGGRVLFLLIEKVRGKRNNEKVEQWVNTIGFAVLIALVVFISFHDVSFLIHK